jgi:uroporphyrinogen decarboxylase
MRPEDKILLHCLKGHTPSRIPFWFMRQAGRHLPEYREVRASCDGFIDLCFTPKKASEVTLQPIRRYGMDGAILFSDILVIPKAMGMGVRFETGTGPLLDAISDEADLVRLHADDKEHCLAPIYETIQLTKMALPKETTFLGFAGAPWTVACYMLQGKGGNEFIEARSIAYQRPEFVSKLIEKITQATIAYLRHQIEAGVDAVQIFDSWAGFVNPHLFDRFVIQPTQNIVSALKESHPDTPIIGFPKGAVSYIDRYTNIHGLSAIGVDQFTDLSFAKTHANGKILQGNLDPILLATNKEEAVSQAKKIKDMMGDTPFVFNLGHGVIPQTPIEHVMALSEWLRHG